MSGTLVLAVALLVLSIVSLANIAWAVMRERHMVDMHNKQTYAMTDVERTLNDGTEAIRAGFHEMARQIERSDELSDLKRREMTQLILDSERRCMDTMRDLINNLRQQGMQVNFNRDAASTQIGNGNHQE